MNKLILPIILGIFVLFFSGKSIPKNNCGPTVNITYDNDLNNQQITKLTVTNSAGQTTTYTNPSFPITYYGSGGLLTVVVFLSGRDNFCIWSWVQDGSECNVVNYHNSPGGSLQFITTCNEYLVAIVGLDPQEYGICP
ncbi:hypothetical protein A4D02_22220 [Niastella koreensis]|uniref:Uncharacterized protein n=2 Tax=Niastella koreensis TaxID=354356 RepID=G8TFK3_NIAKG|nr:hypothetical protein [Niastella koreensis]AEV98434.1 hypothetical protein Niako_2079 [Niastella koreensis GR20-10]OQP53119.1 hypothetical protein A4D02_22220 [Niastella koreensis]